MDDVAKLYQDTILDHHRAPRNAGRLPDPTHTAEAHNPLCGDRVHVSLRVGTPPGVAAAPGVLEVRCDAQGCALCRASGSLLTELVQGQGVSEVLHWLQQFLKLANGAPDAEQGLDGVLLARIAPLLEVRKFPSRRRCVSLSWEALRAALGAEP